MDLRYDAMSDMEQKVYPSTGMDADWPAEWVITKQVDTYFDRDNRH